MDIELTDEERKAIASLKRLAKKWPDSLWLFVDGNSLSVMRKRDDGTRAHLDSDCVDPDYMVDAVNGIDNDGGDW